MRTAAAARRTAAASLLTRHSVSLPQVRHPWTATSRISTPYCGVPRRLQCRVDRDWALRERRSSSNVSRSVSYLRERWRRPRSPWAEPENFDRAEIRWTSIEGTKNADVSAVSTTVNLITCKPGAYKEQGKHITRSPQKEDFHNKRKDDGAITPLVGLPSA